jgi:hypothetical protein
MSKSDQVWRTTSEVSLRNYERLCEIEGVMVKHSTVINQAEETARMLPDVARLQAKVQEMLGLAHKEFLKQMEQMEVATKQMEALKRMEASLEEFKIAKRIDGTREERAERARDALGLAGQQRCGAWRAATSQGLEGRVTQRWKLHSSPGLPAALLRP